MSDYKGEIVARHIGRQPLVPDPRGVAERRNNDPSGCLITYCEGGPHDGKIVVALPSEQIVFPDGEVYRV